MTRKAIQMEKNTPIIYIYVGKRILYYSLIRAKGNTQNPILLFLGILKHAVLCVWCAVLYLKRLGRYGGQRRLNLVLII